MKIISLRFSNLNSLQGQWFIDFSAPDFLDNGLFAITGATGAGKTTILDGICLGLYHQTPRLGMVTASNNEIMSRGTAHCSAEVVFQIKQHLYRATWSMRRSRNKVEGKLQPAQCELAKVNPNGKDSLISTRIDEKLKGIESLTGLNFERFNKSMMLSQGKFAEFLNASENDRAELLEELTGTAIYSQISMLVHQQFSQSKNKLDNQQEKASAYQFLGQEEKACLEQELAQNKYSVEDLEQEIKVYQEHINWVKEYYKAFIEHSKAKHLQKEANHQWQTLEPERKALSCAQEASLLKVEFDKLQGLNIDKLRLIKSIESSKQSFEKQSKLNKELQLLNEQASKNESNQEYYKQEQQTYLREVVAPQDQAILQIEQNLHQVKQEHAQTNAEIKAFKTQEKEQKYQQGLLLEKQQALALDIEAGHLDMQFADEIGPWQGQLSGLKQLLAQLTGLLQKQEEKQKDKQQFKASITQTQNDIEQDLHAITALKDELNSSKDLLSSLSSLDGLVVSFEQVLEAENKQRNNLQIVANLELLMTQFEELERSLQEQRNELLVSTSNFECDSKKLSVLKQNVSELEQTLSDVNTLLSQEEKLQEFREALRPGSPCQLCGSTEHPSLSLLQDDDKYQYDGINVGETLARKKTLQAELNATQAQLEKWSPICEEQEAILRNLEHKIANQEKLQVQFKEQWKGASSDIVNNIEIYQEDIFYERKQNLSDNLQKLNDAKKDIVQTQNSIDECQANLAILQNKQKQKELEKDKSNFALQRVQQECSELQTQITANSQDLSKMLNGLATSIHKYQLGNDIKAIETLENNRCVENLQSVAAFMSSFDAFLVQKQKSINEIKSAQEKHHLIEQSLQKIASPLAVLLSNLANLEDKNSALTKQIAELSVSLKEARGARQNLLGGQTIEQFLNEINARLQDLKAAHIAANNELTQAKSELIAIQERISLHSTELQDIEAKLSHAEFAWQQTLDDSNFIGQDDFEAALMNDSDKKQLQEKLDILNTNRQTLQTKVETFKQSLNTIKHDFEKLSKIHGDDKDKSSLSIELLLKQSSLELQEGLQDQLLEELQYKLRDKTKLKESLLTTQGEINNKLAHDEQSRKAHAKTIQDIEALQLEVDELSTLNGLIGSAKGDSFRRFAQGLSLDHLIYLANKRLAQLHGRYELSRTEKSGLSLAIKDTWQADELRHTKTLSGGESFLVSLALALGLSDLVSNKMSIESLFLDEGFGTLDEATLDIALGALEQLNASGKMIGVISHVEALKERIPTQIVVKKEAGAGLSKLDDIYSLA